MTKKKRVTLIVVVALVLAAASFCLWYTRPLTLFYGQLEIGVSDHIWQATVPDQDQWLSDVMDIIRQFPAEG